MDRFHARASMVFWTILNYRQYRPSPLPVRKEFEKLFIHYSQIDFSTVEQALAEQRLLVIDPTAAYQLKPTPHRRLVRWPSVAEPIYEPGHFAIKARQFLSVARGLYRVGDAMIRMPLNSLIGTINLAILEALWKLLGGSDPKANPIVYEPQLIVSILHALISDHPEVTAGDVYNLIHANAIQSQWLERVTIDSHPDEVYYRRRQALQRPIGKANQLHYQQPLYA